MTNNLLTGKVVGISSSADAHFQCTFQSGFTGFAHCTLKYGTDPTYMILPYSAESTATGTAGDSISVIPREQLNSSTVYYYTVSAVIGGITVAVQGTFTTPEYSMYLCMCVHVVGFCTTDFLHTMSVELEIGVHLRWSNWGECERAPHQWVELRFLYKYPHLIMLIRG